MRLWTVQHAPALDVLERTGVLRADGRRAERLFREPYRWMMARMRERGAGTGRFPVWAWHTPKPDLRRPRHLPGGAEGVRIEFEVDPSRVLLSDFDGWHFVLNDHYLPTSAADQDRFFERWDARISELRREMPDAPKAAWDAALDSHFRGEIEASWHRVFDLPLMRAVFEEDMPGHDQEVQACVEEVRAEDVVRVTRFVARHPCAG